ncbi:hypothetical protein LJR153_002217 [Paenibacillus sp. LjRoot153]|uniref:hypothetical protein n=1 Tax=Paenibacillus sp. LjRoot153 TaxID=3342270 RepID=UPI003ED089A4
MLPVKKEYRNQGGGAALDETASVQTVFIVPAGIARPACQTIAPAGRGGNNDSQRSYRSG